MKKMIPPIHQPLEATISTSISTGVLLGVAVEYARDAFGLPSHRCFEFPCPLHCGARNMTSEKYDETIKRLKAGAQ